MAERAKEALANFVGARDPRPVVVYAADRCAPARGGVQSYVEQLIDCLADRFRFVILTATRDAAGLDEAIMRPEPPVIERREKGSRDALVVSARLHATAAAAYRRRCEDEQNANAEHSMAYHVNRWQTMQFLARLLASELGVIPCSNVIVHAMGPWEMSLTADRVFPSARRVVTPFIHPGHWGDDPDSVTWLRDADRIVALTSADQAVCASTGLPPERTVVVPVPYARRAARSMSGPRDIVAFVGVNRPYKGVDVFLAAAELIAPSWPQVEFVLMTSPPQGAEAQVIPIAHGPIRWVNSPTNRERDELLGRSVCLVLPSATEISPYVVLEGWDHGVPAIVSNDAHFRSFVGGGGICVPREAGSVAAAMTHVLSGSVDTRRMVVAGRRRLEELHKPSSVAALMTWVYQGASTQISP